MEFTADNVVPALVTLLVGALLSVVFFLFLANRKDEGWGGARVNIPVTLGLFYPAVVLVIGLATGQGFLPFVAWMIGLLGLAVLSVLAVVVMFIFRLFRHE